MYILNFNTSVPVVRMEKSPQDQQNHGAQQFFSSRPPVYLMKEAEISFVLPFNLISYLILILI
jgi:hypothetical protein